MVDKAEAIKLIIERGTGVVGPVRMMSLLSEAGIRIINDKVEADNIDESFKKLTTNFAAIAPTTRITLLSLAKIYGFSVFEEEKEEKKEKRSFWRLRFGRFFKR